MPNLKYQNIENWSSENERKNADGDITIVPLGRGFSTWKMNNLKICVRLPHH